MANLEEQIDHMTDMWVITGLSLVFAVWVVSKLR